MRVYQDILRVIDFITDEQILTAKGTPVTLDVNRLEFFHITRSDQEKILHKLQDEFNCIEVVRWAEKPSVSESQKDEILTLEAGMGRVSPEDFEIDETYQIKAKHNLRDVRAKFYGLANAGIDTLTDENTLLVANTIELIYQQFNLEFEASVTVNTEKATDYLWALHGNKSLNVTKEHRYFMSGIKRLEIYGAVEGIHSLTDDSNRFQTIYVNPDKLTDYYEELMPRAKKLLKRYQQILKEHSDEYYVNAFSSFEDSPSSKDSQNVNLNSAIGYDDEHGIVEFGKKSEKLFEPASLEGFLFYRVHKADGARINSSDIANDYEAKLPGSDIDITTKKLNNTKVRINGKLQKTFEIENVVEYEREMFWLNLKYCSETSPYKSARSG